MYGNPEALYPCDEGSMFPLSPNTSAEDFSMEHHRNGSSGLLRFRSAPSSFLENFSSNSNGYAPNPELHPINGELERGYRLPYSIGMDSQELLRQNSSPTELFSHLSAQTAYAKLRAARRYRPGNEATEHLISPSGIHSSSLGVLSRISEINISGDGRHSVESWNQPSIKYPENYTGLKRELDIDIYQGGEPRNQANSMFSRQMSLPKTSAEISSMEKLFPYSDSVPLKTRAKRGCATHPRSIAERMRRSRISERMRKLQELVPNMDKQTNTADMLDLAVDYIKDLQMQYKVLSADRAKCKCSAGKQDLVPDRRF